MSTDTTVNETTAVETDEDDQPTLSVDPSKESFERGTWQAAVQRAAVLVKKSATDKKKAGILLWQGSTAAIAEWLEDSTDDVNGEGLAHSLLEVMGTARKGDVSKIKTVGLAALNHGLVPADYDNLSKAYAAARGLIQVAPAQKAEDTAADDAIQVMSADLPKTASTVDSAAKIVLSKGTDDAARALLDALNTETDDEGNPVQNSAAHRSFLRAISAEVNGRIKPAKKEQPEGEQAEKTGAAKATPKAEGSAPRAKSGAAKAKPTPVSRSKGDPNKRAQPRRTASQIEADDIAAENAAAAQANGAPADPSTGDDVDAMLDEV